MLNPSDINVSQDGTVPTPIYFPNPIYLQHNTDYAITVKEVSGATSLWVSRLGEIDLSTGQKIDKQPLIGILYASSNNQAWIQVQEEDLKLNLYVANFNTDVVGKANFQNIKKDMFEIALDDANQPLSQTGEEVWGETIITFTNALDVNLAEGDYIIADNPDFNSALSVTDFNRRIKYGEIIDIQQKHTNYHNQRHLSIRFYEFPSRRKCQVLRTIQFTTARR